MDEPEFLETGLPDLTEIPLARLFDPDPELAAVLDRAVARIIDRALCRPDGLCGPDTCGW